MQKGATILKFSNKGFYPIHIAALNDKFEVVRYLLDNPI